MVNKVEDIRFVDQRALTLAVDIAFLLEESERTKDAWHGSAFARCAITNAALMLECVANSCLGSLSLPSRLLEELDRLPPLSKFDYYLFSRTSKHIDRGCCEAQLASDVLKLRDHIVHPKMKPGSIVGEGESQYVDYGATKVLGIALDNREWSHSEGMKVAEVATNFLRRFFLEWCGHEKGSATRILVCRERDLLNHDSAMWVQMPRAEYGLVQKWLPAILSYMDLRPSGSDA
ncbi:MAG: hypothetical protein C0613_14020 [Desulfobulbaceae bacterium]|nr:MAG: hypothetical protein C0613_14020 [Desulfobulbaceae bacterium]